MQVNENFKKGELAGVGRQWCTGRAGRAFLKRSPGFTHCFESCEESAKRVDKRDSADVVYLGF